MNPLTNMKNVLKLSEQELKNNSVSSWHDQYKDSAWIFIGGLPYDLTEGDVICIFSQYGEIVNINLVRDKATGKSKGFCFLCYEDQRSTVLAVDNLNGIKVIGRTIRVDHVADYKTPKESKNVTKETAQLYEEGCAITERIRVKEEPVDHISRTVTSYQKRPIKDEEEVYRKKRKIKKEKKEKKKKKSSKHKKSKSKKKKKKKRKSSSSESSSESSSDSESDSD
uniref:Putative rna-binding motif protein x-linked 2 n=1 Tax=Triatoma dimidiata TaxID=72491 RepID=A0A0V0GC17_TRIDM